ncbi:hypothetical protein ACT4UM_11345, partial [Bacillus sp. SS-TM]
SSSRKSGGVSETEKRRNRRSNGRRKRIRERQKEGITIALQKGVKFGRKKVEIDDNFKEVYQ